MYTASDFLYVKVEKKTYLRLKMHHIKPHPLLSSPLSLLLPLPLTCHLEPHPSSLSSWQHGAMVVIVVVVPAVVLQFSVNKH